MKIIENAGSIKNYYVILMTFYFLSHVFSFAFPLMSIILREKGQLSTNTVLFIMSLAFLVSGSLNLYVGKIIDAGRGRSLIIVAVTINMAGIAGMMTVQKNIFLSLLSIALFLVGLGALNTFSTVILEASVPDKQLPKASSVFYGAGSMGFGISAVIAHFFFQSHLVLIITLDGISTALLGLFLFSAYKNRFTKTNQDQKRLSKVKINFRLSTLLLCHTLLFITLVCPVTSLPLLYGSLGLNSHKYTTLMIGTNNIVVVLICFVFAGQVTRIPEIGRFIVGVLCLAVGYILVPYIDSQIKNFFTTCLWSTGEALLYPVAAATIYRYFGEDNKGVAAGSKSLITRLAFVVSPLFGIALQGQWQYYGVLYGSLPIIAFCLYSIHKLQSTQTPLWQQFSLPKYIQNFISGNNK